MYQSRLTQWTREQHKMFENALAQVPEDLPDRWQKVADLVPGASPEEMKERYDDLVRDVLGIEAGLFEVPNYTKEDSAAVAVAATTSMPVGRLSVSKPKNGETSRKKGTAWTEEEHKRFLIGLQQYGKGDWKNISRNVVVTRTPTQVASHAQKYDIRQNSGKKGRKRSSIHDITTVDITPVPVDPNPVPLPALPMQQPLDQLHQFNPPNSMVLVDPNPVPLHALPLMQHPQDMHQFNPPNLPVSIDPNPFPFQTYPVMQQPQEMHQFNPTNTFHDDETGGFGYPNYGFQM